MVGYAANSETMKNALATSAIMAVAIGLISAHRAVAQPDLTPYQPAGWSDKIVVTTSPTSTTDSANLMTTDTLYVDWSVINDGSQAATETFQVDLLVDSVSVQTWSLTNLPPGYYYYVTGYEIGSLTGGSHTVEIVADFTDAVTNDNHSDDSYTKTITIGAVTLPAPTLDAPGNGSTGQPLVPYFSWSQISNASSYRLLIATDAADLPSSPTATNGGSSVLLDAIPLTNNFSPTITLAPKTTYSWEVHGRPAGSDDGTWSSIGAFTTGTVPNGLIIVPIFDSTITSDPQAATIEATINAAISVYRTNFSDAVTATFTYSEMTNGLGYNDASEINESYSDYLTALTNHATTPDDATALAYLSSGPNNPVNGNPQVTLKLPLARALGFSGANPSQGQSDAIVYLNTGNMNLSSTVTDPTKYSLFACASHETDEALGFGSVLNGAVNGTAAPTGPVLPEDLFRYDQDGNRTLSTSLNATTYFSLDGTNELAQFNQYDGGDFGDWYSYYGGNVPHVQDAFASPGANPVLNVELRVMDVIGFTRVIPATNVAPQLTAPTVSAGNFQFNLSGIPGGSYVIQVSANLRTWLPLSTNTLPASGSISITNALGNNSPQFYRAALVN
jgi:hypothetical protein